MDWYSKYKLIEDGDGYTLEIQLNNNSAEFGEEFLSRINENVVKIDDKINNLIKEKFSDIKITSVKLMAGAIVVATIPFFSVTAAAEALPTSATQTVVNSIYTVTASQLNVRTGPSTTNTIMHTLWYGNQVKVIGESGNWYKIQLSDGRTGWVSKTYLRAVSADLVQQKINKVIVTAKSLIGTPYVFGGESLQEGGFDCSGLTQYVFKQVGISLNRISKDQAVQGIYVSQSNMQPGDLVFFSFNMNGIVDHVGIYIGNGQMIHSPKTGDVVKVTNINVTYWQQRHVTTRRMIY